MNGRIATQLRREAEERTVGMGSDATESLYKTLKNNYKVTKKRSDYFINKQKELQS